jgi:hypothetical protein
MISAATLQDPSYTMVRKKRSKREGETIANVVI